MKFKTRVVNINLATPDANPLYCLEIIKDIEQKSVKANKSLIIALDTSGSMSGSAIDHGKKAVIELAKSTRDAINYGILFTYNIGTTSYTLNGKDFESKVNSIKANDRTSFCSIFGAIKSYIENINKEQESVCVIFMTDGCETFSSTQDVMNSLSELHKVCQGKTVEFHAIGLKPEHDVYLLEQIKNIGTASGTFQYVRDGNELAEAMKSLTETICSETISILVQEFGIDHTMHTYKVNPKIIDFTETTDTTDTIGLVKETASEYNGKDEIVSEVLELNVSEKQTIVPITYGNSANKPIKKQKFVGRLFGVNPEAKYIVQYKSARGNIEFVVKSEIENASKTDIVDMRLEYLHQKITSFIPLISNNIKPEHLNIIKENTLLYNLEVQEIAELIRKLDRLDRKKYFPKCQELTDMLYEFYSALASAETGKLTIEKVAVINDMSTKISKPSLRKKLDERIQTNVDMFEKLELKIDKISKQIQQELTPEKLSQVQEEMQVDPGECILSCCNWFDAIKDNDCICIGIEIGRPESAIADPSQVIIHNISNTYLGAEAFLDAFIYNMGTPSPFLSKKGQAGQQIKRNGLVLEFSREQNACIVTGTAREKITGVLPLYINKYHWQIARERMKTIMGWTATLNPLGYAYSQISTIPFAVLANAIQNVCESQTEHNTNKYRLILDTCKAIYNDALEYEKNYLASQSLNLLQLTPWTYDIKKYANAYLSPGCMYVLPEFVRNNKIFAAQVFTGTFLGDIPKQDNYLDLLDFYMIMYGEELRRTLPFKYCTMTISNSKKLIWEILNIDPKFYQPEIDYFKKTQEKSNSLSIGNNEYAKKIYTMMGLSTPIEQLALSEKSCVSAPEFPIIEKCVDDITSFLSRIKIPKELEKHIDRIANTGIKFVEDFYFLSTGAKIQKETNSLALLCVLIQNLIQHTNAARKQAIENNKFGPEEKIDPENRNYLVKPMPNESMFTKYIDFCCQGGLDRAQIYFRAIICELIKDKIRDEKQRILSELNSAASNKSAAEFAKCEDLITAAGMLHGCDFGHDVSYYVKAMQGLRDDSVPLALEKIEMIVTGKITYQGKTVELISDMDLFTKNQPIKDRWCPSKRNIFKLWRRNRLMGTPEQWAKLFPHNTHAIYCRYDSETGQFDPFKCGPYY